MGALPMVNTGNNPTHAIIQNQLQLMQSQLQLLGAQPVAPVAHVVPQELPQPANTCSSSDPTPSPTVAIECHENAGQNETCQTDQLTAKSHSESKNGDDASPKKKVFGAGARVNLNADDLSVKQQKYLDQFHSIMERTDSK